LDGGGGKKVQALMFTKSSGGASVVMKIVKILVFGSGQQKKYETDSWKKVSVIRSFKSALCFRWLCYLNFIVHFM
jgi:hypothetical protein